MSETDVHKLSLYVKLSDNQSAVFLIPLKEYKHFLAQLRPQEREILEMRLQGHSNEDIANKLNIYDRKIRRVIEHVRDIATKEGLAAGDSAP